MDMKTSPLALLKDPTLLKTDGLINGEWVQGASRFDVLDPATGLKLADVANLGPADAERAIAAANAAWAGWKNKTAKERSIILRKWYDLLMANQDDLGRLMTAEQGKPLAEAKGEVAYGASFVEWFAEEAKRVNGETLPQFDNNRRLMVLKQPIGVCAAITPWNFPSAMLTRKAGAALAAGCTLVARPASETPLSALALAVLAERAGIPAGVFNVVTGTSRAIGAELTANPVVRKLSFTGSTVVGKLLMRQCADTLKRLSLELGGNAPFIVFDDADLEAAVEGAIQSKYRNTGQTCVCANRFLVQDGIHDAFATRLAQRASELRVGPGREPGVVQGPLINEAAVTKVETHIADALAKGARLLTGGGRHPRGGTFFQPTVLADLDAAMLVAQEETFGPVAPLFRFSTEAEAIALANATEYGLAAYFYTRDLARAWRVSEALEYGMVGVNSGLVSTAIAPFGGVKQSGLGREGSRYGIDEYLEIKYVCLEVGA